MSCDRYELKKFINCINFKACYSIVLNYKCELNLRSVVLKILIPNRIGVRTVLFSGMEVGGCMMKLFTSVQWDTLKTNKIG